MYCIGNLDTAQNSPEHPTQAHERGSTNGEGVKHKIYMSQDTVGSACEQKSMNTAAGHPPTNFLGASDALLSCWVCAVLPHFSKLEMLLCCCLCWFWSCPLLWTATLQRATGNNGVTLSSCRYKPRTWLAVCLTETRCLVLIFANRCVVQPVRNGCLHSEGLSRFNHY